MTMKKLLENFRGYIAEQEDPFFIDSSMDAEQIAQLILSKIRDVANVPADASYKKGKRALHFTNFGSLKDRHAIIQAMVDAGIASEGKVKRLGLYDRAVTNFYILRKNGQKAFIPVVFNQGGTTMASHGSESENLAADAMNNFFAANDLSMEYVALASGGSGHGDDVEVKNPETEQIVHSYEVKASKGSRLDFGQFRLRYDPRTGWVQATGSGNEAFKAAFAILQPKLNSDVRPSSAPTGPSFDDEGAAMFWQSYEPGRTKSISGDVLAVKIPPQLIQDYYAQKGNEYIILGDDVYSLRGSKLMPLAAALSECYALFRIKYHGPKYSYTVTLRGSFVETPETDFDNAMKTIYLT